jgi:hypothetical protein
MVKHKRFRLHFAPTSSSWLNLVERWFGELTDKVLAATLAEDDRVTVAADEVA